MASIGSCCVANPTLLISLEPMKDASEDEQEDDFISQPTKPSDPNKSKAERAEQLRKMMEDDGNRSYP